MLPIKITQMNTFRKIACILTCLTVGAFTPMTLTAIVWCATLGQAFGYMNAMGEPWVLCTSVICLIVGCAVGGLLADEHP